MREVGNRFLYPGAGGNLGATPASSSSAASPTFGLESVSLNGAAVNNGSPMPPGDGGGTTTTAATAGSSTSSPLLPPTAQSASSTSGVEQAPSTGEPPLPEGWEKRLDSSNRIYFVNHKNKTTQWEDPRYQGKEMPVGAGGAALGPLPFGWEMKLTPEGIPYFIDHNTKSTTFSDPRLKGGLGAAGVGTGSLIPGKRTFKWKITQFR